MVLAKGIEMNATNTVSEVYGFLSGVLIILIGVCQLMTGIRREIPVTSPAPQKNNFEANLAVTNPLLGSPSK